MFRSIIIDGHIEPGAFQGMEKENTLNIIRSNLIQPTLFIREIVPRLLKRTHKSAIIFSSSNIDSKYPYSIIYNAIKAYKKIFAMSLREEVKEKVDLLHLNISDKDYGTQITKGVKNLGKRIEPPTCCRN